MKCDNPIILERDVEKVVQVIQEVEKIVECKVEDIRVEEVHHRIKEVVIEKEFNEIEKIVPYVTKVYEEVPVVEEKV